MRKEKEIDILFCSTLGYWDNILKTVFSNSKDEFEVKNWKPNEDNNFEYNPDHSDSLKVFIAPLELAKDNIGKIDILGPAFGTIDSISLFSATKQQGQNSQVATIGDKLTSTILFEIYQKLFQGKMFNSDFFNQCDDLPSATPSSNARRSPTNTFAIPSTAERIRQLAQSNEYMYAIFTPHEIKKYKLKSRSDIREILKIDPILAHACQIEYIPRTVYCIRKDSATAQQLDKLEELFTIADGYFDKAIRMNPDTDGENKSKEDIQVHDEIKEYVERVYAFNPIDEKARKVQVKIMNCYTPIDTTDTIDEQVNTFFTDITRIKASLLQTSNN